MTQTNTQEKYLKYARDDILSALEYLDDGMPNIAIGLLQVAIGYIEKAAKSTMNGTTGKYTKTTDIYVEWTPYNEFIIR